MLTHGTSRPAFCRLCLFIIICYQCYLKTDQYFFTSTSKVNSEAAQHCSNLGLELMTTRNEAELLAVMTFLNNNGLTQEFWLALTLPSNTIDPSLFMWKNIEPMTWTTWGNLEPAKLATQKCVVLSPLDEGWYTRECNVGLDYICQDITSPLISPYTGFQKGPVYFFEDNTLENNFSLTVLVLTEVWSVSLSDCARFCLRTAHCGLVYRQVSGMCHLYDKTTFLPGNQSMLVSGWMMVFKDNFD